MAGPEPRKVFICYRRSDTADITGRFYDRLVAKFGRERIFKDVDSIPLGVDFRKHIDGIIQQCACAIVMIGADWLKAQNAAGGRRIDEELDHVRVEVFSALQREVPLIPILVHNARHPTPGDLPKSIEGLSYRNGAALRSDPHFNADVNFVLGHLDRILNPPPVEPEPVEIGLAPKPAPPPPEARKPESARVVPGPMAKPSAPIQPREKKAERPKPVPAPERRAERAKSAPVVAEPPVKPPQVEPRPLWSSTVPEAREPAVQPEPKVPPGKRKSNLVILGLGAAGLACVLFILLLIPPVFSSVRRNSQDKVVLDNLRMLDAAADQYYLENGVDTVTYDKLVGPGRYVKGLTPSEGEDYTRLKFKQGAPLVVQVADGREIRYGP